MIQFDPRTLASWRERNISDISITITDTGCAGHKIRIDELRDPAMDHSATEDGLTISMMSHYLPILADGRITWTGKKWIFASESINTRCGCGSSFSLKSGNPIQDKIARTKLAIKEKKEGVHA